MNETSAERELSYDSKDTGPEMQIHRTHRKLQTNHLISSLL